MSLTVLVNGARLSKVLNILGLTLLGVLLTWLFIQNFYFSSSYDLLPLREVDDLAFQLVLRKQRQFLSAYQWSHFFSTVDYGYGNIFWTLMTVLTAPAYILKLDRLVIVIPREFSFICYTFCLYFIYKIAQLRQASLNLTIVVLLMVSTTGMTMVFSNRFHSQAFVALLCLASAYLLIRRRSVLDIIFGIFVFGIAVGVKIVALAVLPIIFIAFNADFLPGFYQNFRFILVRNIKYGIVGLGGFVFGFCPTAILQPSRDVVKESFDLLSLYILRSGQTFSEAPLSPWENFEKGFLAHHFGLLLCLTVFAIALFSIRRSISTRYGFPLFSLISLMAIALVFFLAVKVKNGPAYLAIYAIPLVYFIPFALFELEKLTRFAVCIALALFSLNLYLQRDIFYRDLFLYYNASRAERTVAAINEYEIMEKAVPIYNGDNVIIDHRILFPLDIMHTENSVRYLFDDAPSVDWDRGTLFVLYKKSDIWFKSCTELSISQKLDLNSCEKIKIIFSAKGHYSQAYDSRDLRVIRRIK